MNTLQKTLKPISIFLTALLLLFALFRPPAWAAIIATEDLSRADRHQETRHELREFISREQIRQVLIAWGVDPHEAEVRIDSLSDDEIALITDNFAGLPAGGNAWGFVVVCAIVVIILVIIVEYTSEVKLFPGLGSSN
jgi:hypothetical protein